MTAQSGIFFSANRLIKFSQSIFFVEFVYPAGRVEYFLLTRVERVTNRANLDLQTIVGKRGLCLEVIAATTFYGNLMVFGMNASFHWSEFLLYYGIGSHWIPGRSTKCI